MKRFFLVGALAVVAVATMAARPAGEYSLFVMLNGEPAWIGTSCPGCDGGSIAIIDAGSGKIVKTIAHSSIAICPGVGPCVCPSATNLANFNNAAVGEKLTAEVPHFMVLQDSTTRISTAACSGSTAPDGGVGSFADHWIMK